MGIGITPAVFEEKMKAHEAALNKIVVEEDCKKMISDVVTILDQEGYTAGAKIIERMFEAYE